MYKDLEDVKGTEKDVIKAKGKYKRQKYLMMGYVLLFIISIIFSGEKFLPNGILKLLVVLAFAGYFIHQSKSMLNLFDSLETELTSEETTAIEKKLDKLARKHSKLYAKGHNRAYHDTFVIHGGNSMYGTMATSFWISLAITKRISRFYDRYRAKGALREIRACQYLIANNEFLRNYYYGYTH